MLRRWLAFIVVSVACGIGHAAERLFDFGAMPEGKVPTNFTSLVTGIGAPGDWRVVPGELPATLQPLTPNAPKAGRGLVLAQLSTDATEERFPALIFDGEVFGDFTFSTKFKCVDGKAEQMAGLAFRYQDPKNYYVLRASALGNNVRFYKFVNGVRSDPLGPEALIPRGTWHELSVECKGNQIRCLLDGRELLPPLTDNSFAFGKLGFWTKSDSVSHFTDAKVTFTPRETLARAFVRELFERKSSVVSATIYLKELQGPGTRVVASRNEKLIGQAGGDVEQRVIEKDVFFTGDDELAGVKLVTAPLHDRNGEVVAAVRFELKAFKGQTEKSAIITAVPYVKRMEQRFKEAKDLVE